MKLVQANFFFNIRGSHVCRTVPMCSITLQLRHNCAHLRRNLRRSLLLRVVRSLRSQLCIKVRSQCGRNCGAIQQQQKIRVFPRQQALIPQLLVRSSLSCDPLYKKPKTELSQEMIFWSIFKFSPNFQIFPAVRCNCAQLRRNRTHGRKVRK